MIFHQGVYLIDHDPERTREFYAQAPGNEKDPELMTSQHRAFSEKKREVRK